MKILNWNTRRLFGNWAEILMLANEYDILTLSETKLNHRRKNVSIKDFNHVRLDRDDETNEGGLIIYIRKNIQYMAIDLGRVPEGIEYLAI